MNIEKLINEYPESYCEMLEFAYGKDNMSEGGTQAVDDMFNGITLHQKKCLDIGFGLAGIANYLAVKHTAKVTGLEINPWMVARANENIPAALEPLLNFIGYENFPTMPFEDAEFDLVYSKGVLVHLQDKQDTFNEIFRVLKSGGTLVIDDWLSPNDNHWSDRVKQLCEMENLSLFPTSKQQYQHALEQAGFHHIQMNDVSSQYAQYDLQIVKRLQAEKIAIPFQKKFGEKLWHDSIQGYQLIADAMQNKEIIVMNIRAEK